MNEKQNLVELGKRLRSDAALQDKLIYAGGKNPWFVPEFVKYALDAVMNEMLDETKLNAWLGKYDIKPVNKTIALVLAGNLPLVGLHDFLCCYVTGCKMQIKLSSKDDALFPLILNHLAAIDPELNNRVEIVEKLAGFDAVIATGSNNTNRHFEYYFRNYPKILRKNRNSVAVLTGEESDAALEGLADDIFLYFGFGCRNVPKLYVPVGYDITTLFPHFKKYAWLHNNTKYMNNYDYNRTLFLLNNTKHLANEFIMITESTSIPSPVSVLHYEFWHDENVLKTHLKENAEQIQCIVSNNPEKWTSSSSVSLGQSQHPELWDYADGVDTVEFLLGLNQS